MAAGRKVDVFLRRQIQEHRAEQKTDLLGLLLEARREDGKALTDEELLNNTRFLLFAGYDTTASTLTWALLELLSNAEVLTRVEQELDMQRSDQPLTVAELGRLPLLDAVIKETLRLHPSTAILARGLNSTLDYDGYSVPVGWTVMLVPAYTHRMPEYFADPARFDPDRFLAPREEDKRTPYAWVGFGGGTHACIGMGIAQVEIKTVLAQLLRRFHFALVPDQNMTAQYLPITRPKSGLIVMFEPRVRV